jgi:DNA-binding MarR family transcriptional regulator
MKIHEEEIANKFLLQLISLSRHIANVTHEEAKIGSGIFVLHIIGSKPECIMKDIVDSLNLGASTATRQVDSLVKEGLIVRSSSDTDRRKVLLTLTNEGNLVYKRFKNHLILVMRTILKSYTIDKVNLTLDILNTMVEQSESNLPLK